MEVFAVRCVHQIEKEIKRDQVLLHESTINEAKEEELSDHIVKVY